MVVLSYIPPELCSSQRDLAAQCRRKLMDVVQTNVDLIRRAERRGQPLPSIYRSGVVFTREPYAGQFEEFADILTALRRGWVDCDDACAWLCAAYWVRGGDGKRAGIKIYWREPRPGELAILHAQVRRPDGTIEDPSRRLPGG